MFMLDLCEAMDQLAMANSVHWYGHVLRREDGHVLRRALDFEVEGYWKNLSPKRTWKKKDMEKKKKILFLIRLLQSLGETCHPRLLGYYWIESICISLRMTHISMLQSVDVYVVSELVSMKSHPSLSLHAMVEREESISCSLC